MNEHYPHRSYPITDREPLHYTLAEDSDGTPLATFHNLPGGDADLTPEQCRSLAAAFTWAAREAAGDTEPGGGGSPINPLFQGNIVDTAYHCCSVLKFLETFSDGPGVCIDDRDRAGLMWILQTVRDALEAERGREKAAG